MKYCIHARQPLSVLAKAEQIKMRYEDHDILFDLVEKLPEKTFIIEIPFGTEVDWNKMKQYNVLCQDFVLALYDLKMIEKCKELEIQFYYAYPITSYFELTSIIPLQPAYIFIGMPLTFDVIKLNSLTNIPIRMCPNKSYDEYIPRERENGICGQWIRPEDQEYYEPYIDVLEFAANDLTEEQTLLHIYKDNKEWPGNLNLIIKNLNYNIDNRVLPDDFAARRLSCLQRCLRDGICHHCESSFKFAEVMSKKAKKEKTN